VSDEERKMHAKENDEDTGADDDVDAHVRSSRGASDEGDDGDDVEAHVRAGR
jgi:hypothetical protein